MADYMMAKELIARLQEEVDKHGDMPVFKYSGEYGKQVFHIVSFEPGRSIYCGCSMYEGDALALLTSWDE